MSMTFEKAEQILAECKEEKRVRSLTKILFKDMGIPIRYGIQVSIPRKIIYICVYEKEFEELPKEFGQYTLRREQPRNFII